MAKGFSDTPTTMDQERALDNDLFGRVSEKCLRAVADEASDSWTRMTCWYEIERRGQLNMSRAKGFDHENDDYVPITFD